MKLAGTVAGKVSQRVYIRSDVLRRVGFTAKFNGCPRWNDVHPRVTQIADRERQIADHNGNAVIGDVSHSQGNIMNGTVAGCSCCLHPASDGVSILLFLVM